jgi:hypothetical protein
MLLTHSYHNYLPTIMTLDEPSGINHDEREAVMALSSFNDSSIVQPSPTRLISKKRTRTGKRPKKNKIKIPVYDIIRFMTLPQPVAAEKLGVSISTLKRRYYGRSCF